MDTFLRAFSGSKDGCEFDYDSVSASSDPYVVEGFQPKETTLDYDIVDLPLNSNVPDPVIRSTDFSNRLDRDYDAVLRYINQVLMEDDWEDKACTIQDSNLHDAEKSFYEILNKKNPSSPNQPQPHEFTSSSSGYTSAQCCSNFSGSCINANNSVESGIISGLHTYKSLHVHNPYIDCTSLTNSQSFCSSSCSCCPVGGLVESLVNAPLESQSSCRFNGGIKETKILRNRNSGTENNRLTPPVAEEKVLKLKAKLEKDEGDLPDSLLRARKSLHREGSDLGGGRSNKHLAVCAEESLLQEMFDKVVSVNDRNEASALKTRDGALPNRASRESQKNERAKGGSNGEMNYTRKGVSKKNAVDLRSLLVKCMQSVVGNDHKVANQLLTQIRSRSSPSGDGSQRLAHYFANSLEARLAGAGTMEYKALVASMSDADLLKAYKLCLSELPFGLETSFFFATEMIMELAEKATSLHIIHFGISYGLQWPPLIQRLSTRPGGPPKLRITGIDHPQAGSWPDASVKEIGHRLANYCERFNVPFEYNGIARKWETLGVEDLRIEKDEVLVVHCLGHSKYLLDDTIMEHSPRDAVLNLIKRINPNIFIHGVVPGTYNSPFFVSRFREALFYFSAMFDMFEANVPRENQERTLFERNIWGMEILNVIACEGLERVARPETCKQWHIRSLRAGLRQLPLNQEIMKGVRAKVKSRYHKDFFLDESTSQWMLSCWKGRVLIALSCWKPA